VCERRQAILGDGYPFELDRRVPTLRDPQTPEHRPYLALLAITAAHHYEVESDHVPEHVFETLVAEAMGSRGLDTCSLGTVGREVTDFRETVRRAGVAIKLPANADAAPSRTWANDERIDTISHLSWGDLRPGHWLFIGQATVGASGSWETKMMEPAPEQWQEFMGSWMPASAYLAIPHHIEDQHIQYLTQKRRRLVLDRLRLARHVPAPVAGSPADQLIRDVTDAGVYDPRT
jgi:hypothetical protein